MSSARRLLATGVSARALGAAAARAGWWPVILDAFGDADCRGDVHPVTPFTPRRAAFAARALTFDAVAIAAGWEHAPSQLTVLGQQAVVLAPPITAMRLLRDPVRLATLLRAAGLPSLVTAAGRRSSPPLAALSAPANHAVHAWLHDGPPAAAPTWRSAVKPRRSGGGRGIVQLDTPVRRVPGHYLQEWRAGTPVSLIVAGNGRTGVPLALGRQLSGWPEIGAHGLTYAGSLLAGGSASLVEVPQHDRRCRAQLEMLADVLVRGTGLRGLVGVDGILDDAGQFWLLEVNPRWCASFELLDQLVTRPLFDVHVEACAGTLPPAWLTDAASATVVGKAVVYHDRSRPSVRAPDLRRLLIERGTLADVPRPGAWLPPGGPICTMLAEGTSGEAVRAHLRRAADQVMRDVADAADISSVGGQRNA